MGSLLIIVDMQEGFRSPESESILEKVKLLLQRFGDDAVYSCFYNRAGSMFERYLDWKKFQDEDDRSPMAELQEYGRKEFRHPGYRVVTKELFSYIKKKEYAPIILAGVYTDVCITHAAMDLFDAEIPVKVVQDACHSLHGEDAHKGAVQSLQHIIGRGNVISTQEAVSVIKPV